LRFGTDNRIVHDPTRHVAMIGDMGGKDCIESRGATHPTLPPGTAATRTAVKTALAAPR
jgi:hypothetical protein